MLHNLYCSPSYKVPRQSARASMTAEASASPADAVKPALVSRPSVTNEHNVKAFAELKALCEKNKLYWPASEIEGHSAEGYNDDNNLLYVI